MVSQAQSDGIPQDSAPSRSSVSSIARIGAVLFFICGVTVCSILSQPGQEATVPASHGVKTPTDMQSMVVDIEDREDPILNTVKNIRANRRLNAAKSWFEDEEETEKVVTTRRLKGGKGKGGGRGRGYGRSGSKGSKSSKSKSKGRGRSIEDTFSPFPTQTPFPTSTPFPTVTPFPTFTPLPTWTPFPTMTPFPTITKDPEATTSPAGTTAPTATGATNAPAGTTAAPAATTAAPTAAA